MVEREPAGPHGGDCPPGGAQAACNLPLQQDTRLASMAKPAAGLFEKQEPREKRRRLDFVLSNSIWKDGELTPEFRQPFDLLFVANHSSAGLNSASAGPTSGFENWRPGNHGSQQPLQCRCIMTAARMML